MWKMTNCRTGKLKFFLPFAESCPTIKWMLPKVTEKLRLFCGLEFEEDPNERTCDFGVNGGKIRKAVKLYGDRGHKESNGNRAGFPEAP